MRRLQVAVLLVGATIAALGIATLVKATSFASFLAGVFLVGLAAPCLVIGGLIVLARRAGRALEHAQVGEHARRLAAALARRPNATFDELRAATRLPEAALTDALAGLLAARGAREDFDPDRGAYVYAPRGPDDLDPDRPEPPQELPPDLLSVAERRRRRAPA